MQQGTGAGNPLADIRFAIAFCKVIARLRRALDRAGVVVSFQVQGAREYLGLFSGEDAASDEDVAQLDDVSFADDLAFVIATQAHLLLDTLRTAAHHVAGIRGVWL